MDSTHIELVVSHAHAEIGRYLLEPGLFILGSAEDASIPLPHPGVAAEHARLWVSETGEVSIEPGEGQVTLDGHIVDSRTAVYPGQNVGLAELSLSLTGSAGEA